jgi:hydroquinone glucosyltransferase
MAAGVLMIAWPLYAAQRMNAAILSETIGMALRPHERAADGVITREEIAAVVSELMEGRRGAPCAAGPETCRRQLRRSGPRRDR